MPHTKIVATLGPASDSLEIVQQLISAGVDVFRLNASHGTLEGHRTRIQTVRAAAAQAGRFIGILFDLQGPKIRLGKFEGGRCTLTTGARFTITTESVSGNCELASTTYSQFAGDVEPGARVLLADGAVELRALAKTPSSVAFEVVNGGVIGDNKGINLPGVKVSAPSLTAKDLEDLEFALAQDVDMIALSFVRSANDVSALRDRIGDRRPRLPIIAKIEKPEGWENIMPILEVAAGVMVARGDLGVEMALERVPPIQKSLIRKARRRGRFVITATQMLESMIENATPTRAEVSDVANAIFDGTDAVMLSAETSTGKYPVQAVSYMRRIADEAERSIRLKGFEPRRLATRDMDIAEILADSAYHAARNAEVAAIVVFTSTGFSARLISRLRPPVCIYAVTPNEAVARQLSVCFGVLPILAPNVTSTDEMLAQMDHLLLERKLLSPGDAVVFVAGQPVGRAGTTNLMKIHRLGEVE